MYLLLFVIWLLLNGKITLEICLLGLGITVLIGLFMFCLFGYTPQKELRFWSKTPLFAAYAAVLLVEIIKANFTVLSILLYKKRKLAQSLVTFSVDLKTEFAKYVLANSITLTPGTMTVAVDGSSFTVHCLSREMADGLEDGVFVRLLRKLEA